MTATVPIPLDHPHSPPSGQITRTLHPQARSPALFTLRPDHPHSPPSGQITRTLHPQARSPALSTLRPDHPHSSPSGQITRTLHPQARSPALFTLRPDHPHSPPSGQITRTLHPQARSPALFTLRPDHPHSSPSGQITRTLHPQARSPALSTLRPDHPHSPPSGQITRTLHPQARSPALSTLRPDHPHSPPSGQCVSGTTVTLTSEPNDDMHVGTTASAFAFPPARLPVLVPCTPNTQCTLSGCSNVRLNIQRVDATESEPARVSVYKCTPVPVRRVRVLSCVLRHGSGSGAVNEAIDLPSWRRVTTDDGAARVAPSTERETPAGCKRHRPLPGDTIATSHNHRPTTTRSLNNPSSVVV